MLLQETRTRQALGEKGIKNFSIEIVHAEDPKTIINGKVHSLIFPEFINRVFGNYEKYYDISFRGLITPKRKKFFDLFAKKYPDIKSIIINSKNGRDKSKKSFDEDYFELMAVSKFVLCPDGDFKWSYRFFEAILCNAIPVIENDCPLYKGYKFYRLGDKLIYKDEYIKHNLLKISKDMMI
jgi:hypothetical protein